MEHSELHQQKIQILGRLIKESSLTLEEALLLLQEEEVVEPTPTVVNPGITPGSTWIAPYTGTFPLAGSSTGTFAVNGTSTTTTAFLNTPSTLTADLNN